jgi:hypothetical protein
MAVMSSSMDLCPSKKIERSGENLTVLSEVAFSFPLSPAGFSMFNPLPELSLSYPPLTAYLKGRQLVDFDHSVESALGNLEQCRSLVKRQQTDTVELLVHRTQETPGGS